MSTVVNGHREDEPNRPRQLPTHNHGHILPMLSFSASTPTEEDNPLEAEATLAIDVALWEEPEAEADTPLLSGTQQTDSSVRVVESSRETSALPHIEVGEAGILADGPMENADDIDESSPLLGGGGEEGVGGGGLRVDDDGSDPRGGRLGALTLPINMPRSPQASENVTGSQIRSTTDKKLLDTASLFVTDVISKAQVKVSKNHLDVTKVCGYADAVRSDERLMEVVRRFVSDIMIKAKAEAWESMREIQANNNNNVLSIKDEASVIPGSGGGGMTGTHLASPGSAPGERVYRGGPWYVQMGRMLAHFLSRICPCSCPTKP